MSEKDYNGLINPDDYLTPEGRRTVDLGENWDGSHSTLPPYVDIDGIQIHPSRVDDYLKRREEEGLY